MDAVNVLPVAPKNRWREGALDPAARLAYSIPREMRPVRLVAQDTRLSRGQQGFESPTGRQLAIKLIACSFPKTLTYVREARREGAALVDP